jgi:hypothetical protein
VFFVQFKFVGSAICTRWLRIWCLVIVYEYHTFWAPPYIFPKNSGPLLLVATVQISVKLAEAKKNPYVAANRDKSSCLRIGYPTRSTTCEKWNGGNGHLIFGGHLTKMCILSSPCTLIKWKIIFMLKSYKL